MSKKVVLEFVVQGRVEATTNISFLNLETKSKRGRKKLALEPEDYDLLSEESDKKKSDNNDSAMAISKKMDVSSESVSKRSRGRPGRKKKSQDEDDLNEFPAPKSKPSRGRGGAKGRRGRPGKKGMDSPLKEDAESMISSNKNGDESPSNMEDTMDIEEEMKLEDDEEEPMEEDGDEDEDNFEGLNALSTKNILRLTKMQQEESGTSDKNSVTDISSLNIDVNKLTRRQKTQLKNQANLNIDIDEPLLQLPDKKPRKRKDIYLTEEQQVKKMETANKRKMLNQKLQEEQKKLTINKILNEAGRKQRLRKEKEEKDQKDKENYQFRALPNGEVGIKFISKANGSFLVLPEGFNVQNLLIDPNY